jgi:DNA polymerase-3 subunit alpha
MAVVDKAMERAQKAQRDAEAGQHGLFGVFDDAPRHLADNGALPDLPEWEEHQRLAAEKEILGFFITGHPLQKYEEKLQAFNALSSADLSAMTRSTGKDETITTAGIVTNVRVLKSKRGDFYAQAVLEDMLGTVEMIVFPDAYKRNADKLKLEVPVLIRAGLRVEEDSSPKLTLSEITPLEDVKVRLPRSIRIRIPLEVASPESVDELHAFCVSRPGEAKVLFDVTREGDFMAVLEAERYNVLPDRAFFARMEELFGRDCVRVID